MKTGGSDCVIRFDHEINQMQKLEGKLYLLMNSREVSILDIATKTVDLRVEFEDHNVTCIYAMLDYLLFGDTFNHLYAVKSQDLAKDDPKQAVLKKERLLGHEGWILHMFHWDGYLFTCSDDKSIKVWELPSLALKDELIGHKNGVSCLTIANDFLYSGGYDLTIRSWSISEMKDRIKMREIMKAQEIYSIKAEAYKSCIDSKKKKRLKRGKGKSKSKSPKKKK